MKAEWTNKDSLTQRETTKAILVIDMPSNCAECPSYAFRHCLAKQRVVLLNDMHKLEKPEWCPLRPIPEKMKTDANDIEEDSYFEGWNDCLDEITREEE